MSTLVPDENSMKDPLCNSSFGSMVSLDYVTPDTEQKCVEMDELAQQDFSYRLSKEEFKRYQGQWYLTFNNSGKTRQCDFDQTSQSDSKRVSIVNQVKKLQNQYLHNNTGDGTLPQVIPGATGTRPKAGGVHDENFLRGQFILFVTVGLVYS